MTNNQLTDERVTSVIERLEHYACNLKWTNVRGAQDLLTAADGLRELQERRKADSEPVIIVGDDGGDALSYRRLIQSFEPGTQLYRHAQPAQVCVPTFEEWCERTEQKPVGWVRDAMKEAYDACRAATLAASPQPAPVVPDDVLEALQKVARIRLDLNDFNGDRRGIADCLGDAEEALIEVVNRRAAMLNGGKP